MASTSYGGSSSTNNYAFDIFINHRGPDCKKTLAKHLYESLSNHGLRVFLDEDELQNGENITPQIVSAIRTASVHIAIFTPRYAESSWCLDELLLMFESRSTMRSTIIPVFYGGVKPADLRWGTQSEKGDYGRALQELEKKAAFDSTPRYDPDTIQKWRKALTDAAEIKGFDLHTYNGDEQQLLQHVVEGVLEKVKRPLHVSRYPTGLNKIVAEFERAMLLHQQSSRETRVIGIFGLGGAGKTTLAKEIFNRRRSNYKKSCFLFDVRENAAKNTLKSLQTRILRDFGIKENVQIDSTDDGIEKLERYLKSSHAFLVLDDVDHLQQLEALLLPVKDVVQQGSLILVTSRNKDILTGIAESSIFKLTGLDQDHSRELFCWHAFDRQDPPIEFEQVVEEFLHACAGLPLSLKVFGSLLCRKDLQYWNAQLHKLSKILPEDILGRLKISYDGLDKIEKQIFLDIVCFFIGENKDTAIRIWDGTEWDGWLGLRNLESRSLVEVDDENCIRMHDHVRDLGRHIAESEPPDSTHRLSCPTHDLRLLSDNSLVRGIRTVHSQGCESAQPLFINLAEYAGSRFPNYVRRLQRIRTESRFSCVSCVTSLSLIWLSWVDSDFVGSRFKNYVRGLQLLRAQGYFIEPEFMESIISVATSLIWLSWVDFPYSYIPSWIPLKNLRVLRIEGSELKKLWLDESQAPEHLRELYIDASDVERLKVPKSIGKLRHLEKFVAAGCRHLTLPAELCHLKSLKHLELRGSGYVFSPQLEFEGCSSLNMLPDSFGNLMSLENLSFFRWSNLKMLAESFGKLTNLQTIDLGRCSSLQVLPDSFGKLTNLQTIHLLCCSSLQVLPESFGNLTNIQTIDLTHCSGLQVLPDSFGKLTNLQTIKLYGCSSLQVLPDWFGKLTNLQTIDLEQCSSLQVLPDSFEKLTNLQTINPSYCLSLQVLPDSFGKLTNLQTINLSCCCNLQVLPDSFGNLTNLQTIDLEQCSSLQVLPDSFGNLTNLQTIVLRWCESLQVLPDSFGKLTNLQTIDLSGCSSLQVLPDSFGNLTNLQTIGLSKCSSLQVLPDSFWKLTNLQTIDLSGSSSLQVFPDSFGNLTNLRNINMWGCSSLQVLPDSFGSLIQLEHLTFDSLTVSPEVFEKMHTFKCSGLINFNRVKVLPAPL